MWICVHLKLLLYYNFDLNIIIIIIILFSYEKLCFDSFSLNFKYIYIS